MYLFSTFSSEAKLTKKILQDSGIPLADENVKFEIYDGDENIISKCKTGNFYYGIYNNQKVIIKKIDITKDELILNELEFWKSKANPSFYLKMINVLIKNNYAYIIFEKEFKTTLKKKLQMQKQRELTLDNKIKIVKQLLAFLNYLNKNNIKNTGLRSSTIGLDSEYKIKIFDYGELVDLNTKIENDIKEEINKYSPLEYINENEINETFDIFSFGCILKDLFSQELNKNDNDNDNDNNNDNYNDNDNDNNNDNLNNIINNENKTKKNINNINHFLVNIIYRCIEPDKEKRIRLEELNKNLQLVLNCYYNNNNNNEKNEINKKIIDNVNEKFLNEYENIKNYYFYGKNLMDKINIIFKDMNDDLYEKIRSLKTEITSKYDVTYNQIEKITNTIIDNLIKFIESSKKIIDTFYNKLLESTINMQEKAFNNTLNDIYDIIELGNGMLLDISILSNFDNQKEYLSFQDTLEKTKNEMDELLRKNSKETEFDLIFKIYENKSNNYQKFCKYINETILPLQEIENNLEKYIELNNNKMNKVLAINLDIESLDKDSKYFKSMNENIYAKIEENTNLIYIYNYYTKSISSHQIKDIIFNSKNYSFFDKEENCIYVSGGLVNDDNNYYDNSLFKIFINFVPKEKEDKSEKNNIIKNNKSFYDNIYNFGEYQFEITKLNLLKEGRYSHCMIRSRIDRRMLINIGGKNTKSCEVYNLEKNKSSFLPDLPSICPNPTSIEYDGFIYLFNNSEFNLNTVYYLDMNKEDNFIWESIQFNMNYGSIKRAMNIIDLNNSLYLFGGFDENKEYLDIYKVTFNKGYLDINFCNDISLEKECHFNSNAIIENNNIENNKKKQQIVILMDSTNEVNEVDFSSRKHYYYYEENNY